MRLELAALNLQILMHNGQLFNVLVTAHAVFMGAMSNGYVVCKSSVLSIFVIYYIVNRFNSEWIKPIIERYTEKLELKGITVCSQLKIDRIPKIEFILVTLRNLIHVVGQTLDLALKTEEGAFNSLIIGTMNDNKITGYYNTINYRVHSTYMQEPKWTTARHNRNSWLSKGNNLLLSYDNGGLIVLLTIGSGLAFINKRTYSTKITFKDNNVLLNNNNNDNNNLLNNQIYIKKIADIKNLIKAYQSIKNKLGNMTLYLDNLTLDEIKLLEDIKESLLKGIYKYSLIREVWKLGNSKLLRIMASLRDKIVQKAIEQVMELYYNLKFRKFSHGSTLDYGIHSALEMIDAQFQSVRFVIESNLIKYFNDILHDKFMNILKKDITCQKTLKLIKSGLKIGYFKYINILNDSSIGILKGEILSLLLCNIYLHELDMYIEQLMELINQDEGKRNFRTSEYWAISNQVRKKTLSKIDRKKLIHKMLTIKSIDYKRSLKALHYVRYLDDFVIGVKGLYSLAKDIHIKIDEWLGNNLNLSLNKDRTKIIDFWHKLFNFLGFLIKSQELNNKEWEHIKYRGKLILRRKKVRLSFYFDYQKLLKTLMMNNFIKLRNRLSTTDKVVRGTSRNDLINWNHIDILNYYNSIRKSIYYFYRICNNQHNLVYILWLLEESYVLTLSKKFKLKSMKKVYKKFGKSLRCTLLISSSKNITKLFFRLKSFTKLNISKWKIVSQDLSNRINLYDILNSNSKIISSNLFVSCLLCGSDNNVEIHDLRSIKLLKDRFSSINHLTYKMNTNKFKQVLLCREHYLALHNKTLTLEEIQVIIKLVKNSNINRK